MWCVNYLFSVNALEQAKSMGNIENPEELIASIAEKVQQRQTVRQQQNNKSGPKIQVREGQVCLWVKIYMYIFDSWTPQVIIQRDQIRHH